MSNYIFTITAGRTGTAWLTELISNNLEVPSIHEPLEIDDFGTNMPEIKIMRSFNDRGYNKDVKEFWNRKFDNLIKLPSYFESNHTLSKCGLLEHCYANHQDKTFTFLCVRRDYVNLCKSYIDRGDFDNMTMRWQWYLDHNIKRKIVDPLALVDNTLAGPIIWYIFEIEARQEYYKILYGDVFNFIDLTLENMTTQDTANNLVQQLGGTPPATLPPAKNQNLPTLNDDGVSIQLRNLFDQIDFNPKLIAKQFIDNGHRLG